MIKEEMKEKNIVKSNGKLKRRANRERESKPQLLERMKEYISFHFRTQLSSSSSVRLDFFMQASEERRKVKKSKLTRTSTYIVVVFDFLE
jgi:hypothetical protein